MMMRAQLFGWVQTRAEDRKEEQEEGESGGRKEFQMCDGGRRHMSNLECLSAIREKRAPSSTPHWCGVGVQGEPTSFLDCT